MFKVFLKKKILESISKIISSLQIKVNQIINRMYFKIVFNNQITTKHLNKTLNIAFNKIQTTIFNKIIKIIFNKIISKITNKIRKTAFRTPIINS
jgi:hypothetical protein